MKRRLKGHKPGCRCVACSPATRKSGLEKIRSKSTRAMVKRAKKFWRGVKKNAPSPRYVGSNVVLNGKGLGLTSRILAGPGSSKVTVVAGKFARRFAVGDVVRRAEYDNRAKAIRAYGKPGRFYHNFKGGVRVASVNFGKIILSSRNPLWRAN